MTPALQRRWFTVAAVVIAGGAPVFSLGATQWSGITHWSLDLLSWPLDGDMALDDGGERLLAPILGGILLGWGVTMWGIGRYLYDAAPEAARKVGLIGTTSWLLLDSLGSLAAGIPANAVWNLLFYLIASFGFWRPARLAAG